MDLKKTIREVPDFPKPGILFYDITTMLQDPQALNASIEQLYEMVKDLNVDKVAAIESRGYIFAVPLALKLGAGFSIIRKPGKLPHTTLSKSYDLEYGSNTIEIHTDAVTAGENVLLVDDLLATGGTMQAAVDLINELKGNIVGIALVIELLNLQGRKKLDGYDVRSLLKY